MKKNKSNFEEDIVNEIIEDFKNRQAERKVFESAWELNINFYLGNQYCNINPNNEIINNTKQYFWQEREVYNHIAPLIEIRLNKLSRVRPTLTVVPFSDDDNDMESAKASKKILKAVSQNINLSSILSKGTLWSELCGTCFYKVTWDNLKGKKIGIDENGVNLFEGDVDVNVVSPFEIFPDSNSNENIEDCASIIHARAFNVETVKNIWGIDLIGKDIDVFSLDNIDNMGGLGYSSTSQKVTKTIKKNNVLVIEKYEAPTIKFPNGRLIIVAGDKLVYIGELPYINNDGKQGYPFIKQSCNITPNCFWGNSIIERCIPIQRSYNAVKNRKHEFLNRIAMGIMAVEDGSVDTENLEEEGLSPGKVLIYRQGSTPPTIMTLGSVPLDFQYEENSLLNEFLNISGVSDLLKSSSLQSGAISGVALQLLVEQDENRLLTSAEEIRQCAKLISKHILNLYKQFAIFTHTSRILGENGDVEMFYWKNTDISSDEIVFETENELNETLAQKRSMIMEIFATGLLNDEDGTLNNSTRRKILDQLGFGVWETNKDIKNLQIKKANIENYNLLENDKIDDVLEIDDHDLHISEHTCFMLSKEFLKNKNSKNYDKLLEHIKQHKKFKQITENIEQKNLIK